MISENPPYVPLFTAAEKNLVGRLCVAEAFGKGNTMRPVRRRQADLASGTIEVGTKEMRGIVSCLEAEVASLKGQRLATDAALVEKQSALAELKIKLHCSDAVADNGGDPKRLRKGEAERIVVDLLASLPSGERGLLIQEVVDQSGVPYSSVFRVLTKNKNGRFDNPEGLWMLGKK